MFRSSISLLFFYFCAEAMDWFIDFVWCYCYGFVCFCFCVVLLALLLTFLLQVIKLLTIWYLVVLLCFPNCFRYECLLIWFISGSIDLNWDWFINRLIDWIDWLIDWLIDWSTDRSIDWSIGCLPIGCWFCFVQSLAPMSAVTLARFCWPFVFL